MFFRKSKGKVHYMPTGLSSKEKSFLLTEDGLQTSTALMVETITVENVSQFKNFSVYIYTFGLLHTQGIFSIGGNESIKMSAFCSCTLYHFI